MFFKTNESGKKKSKVVDVIAGAGIWVGRSIEEVCGGTGAHVVAQHPRSGLTFPVSHHPPPALTHKVYLFGACFQNQFR